MQSLGIYTREIKVHPQNSYIHKYIIHKKNTSVCTQICISFIHDSLQLETTQMSIIIWTDKQDTIQWNDIDNNKLSSYVNMNQSQKYAEQKRLDKREHPQWLHSRKDTSNLYY